MKPTGPTNPILKNLIQEIRNQGYKENSKFLISLAKRLEISSRRRPEVPLTKINRHCKENETALVSGKLLDGILEKKLKISAFSISKKARETIKKAGGQFLTIKQLIKENPKGTNVRFFKW